MGFFPWRSGAFAILDSPEPLLDLGLSIPVELSTASIFRQTSSPAPMSSIVVMAHFDTGASVTSIDINLAKYLNLLALGQSPSYTASGLQVMPNFSLDLSFPHTTLSPFVNLNIGSCHLHFDVQESLKNNNNPRNFGILLGRDVMAKWNIVWNGPTSTVFISD